MSIETPTINWQNADVMTPDDLFLSVSVFAAGGSIKVFRNRNDKVAEGTIAAWMRNSESRAYTAIMENGDTWKIVKLKCYCADPEKSGRIWF